MAALVIVGQTEITIELSGWNALPSLRRIVHIPLAAIRFVKTEQRPEDESLSRLASVDGPSYRVGHQGGAAFLSRLPSRRLDRDARARPRALSPSSTTTRSCSASIHRRSSQRSPGRVARLLLRVVERIVRVLERRRPIGVRARRPLLAVRHNRAPPPPSRAGRGQAGARLDRVRAEVRPALRAEARPP